MSLDEIIDKHSFNDGIPSNLLGAVNDLKSKLSEADLDFICELENLCDVHHSLGRQIRNQWKLWQNNNVLVEWFKTNLQIGHADDISAIILEALQSDLRGKVYCPRATVKRFHGHWELLNCNNFGELLNE